MDLQAGATVGRVRLRHLLGKGGMGEVWEGFDEALQRRVAVKTIHQRRRETRGGRERFLREARLLSQLDHPNVCRVYEMVEGEDADFLVLELVEGESLADLSGEPRSPDETLRIAEQIAQALAAAHAHGIVHRDLKPGNVMLTPGGTVKVLDFGVARLVREGDSGSEDASEIGDVVEANPEDSWQSPTRDLRPPALTGGSPAPEESLGSGVYTEPGSLVGTPGYMSPEQAAGDPVRQASDLYSFGVLLQELLTGRRAYAEVDNPALLRDMVLEGRVRPAVLGDEGLEGLLADLLSVDPERRPSAREVQERLRELRERPAARRRRRFRMAASLGGILVLAAAVATTLWLARPSPIVVPESSFRVAVLPFRNRTGDEGLQWVEQGLQHMTATALSRSRVDTVDPAAVADAVSRFPLADEGQRMGPETLQPLAEGLGADLFLETRLVRSDPGFRLEYALYDPGGMLTDGFLVAPDPVTAARGLVDALARRLAPGGPLVDFQGAFSHDAFANQAYAIGVQRGRTTGAPSAEPYFRVCLDRDPDFELARLKLSDTLLRTGRVDESREAAERVADRARGDGDVSLLVQALRQLGVVDQEQGNYDAAEARYREALTLLEESPDDQTRIRVTGHLGVLRYRQGDLEGAREDLETSLELARARGFDDLIPPILTPLAYVHLRQGDAEGAEALFRETLERVRRQGNREWEAGTLTNLATLRLRQGDLETAAGYTREAYEAFTELENAKGRLISLINLGAVRLHQGDLDEAERLTREALSLTREVGDRRSETFALAALGYFQTRRGDLDQAEASLTGAEKVGADLGDPEISWQLARNGAYLLALQGRVTEAATRLEEALAIKRDGLTILTEARIAYAEGRFDRALALIEEARARGDVPWAPWRDDVLAVYRRAAAEGRTLPLPDESPPPGTPISGQ